MSVVVVETDELARLVEAAVSRAVGGAQDTPAGWLDTDAAATHLGLTEPSLRSMRQRGEGPEATTFPNGRVRFAVADLDAWARSAS
jgi:hypothetical protein